MAKYTPVTSWDDVPIVMDLPFASRIVGQTVECLKRRSQAGNFPAYKEGKEWRVSKETLRNYISQKERENSHIDFPQNPNSKAG